jgi:hypothetical protein
MRLKGKTRAKRATEIQEQREKREKRRKKARARQRWQDQRSKWRAEGRKMFGGEEGRQRAAAAVRAFLVTKPPLWINVRAYAPSVEATRIAA